MADAVIQVIIEAQDKISAQLKNIEGKIKDFGDENKKVTEKMSTAWQTSTNKLLAIGNVAAGVDRIFSSLVNMQLRLENSTERLTNAQERLTDSTTNLNRAQTDLDRAQRELAVAEKTRFEDFGRYERAVLGLENAQQRVNDSKIAQERATRNLTIAENNLAKTQNQVLGTYISIGIQSISLLQSIPMLITQFGGLVSILTSLSLIGGIAIAASILIDKGTTDEAKKQFSEVTRSWDELKRTFKEDMGPVIKDVIIPWIDILSKALAGLIWSLNQIIDLIHTMGDIFGGAIKKTGSNIQSNWQGLMSGNMSRVHDAVIKPDGTIIQTDPKDTLVAMKDVSRSVSGMRQGGGMVIEINGPIYGVNADDISRALLREFSRKVTI